MEARARRWRLLLQAFALCAVCAAASAPAVGSAQEDPYTDVVHAAGNVIPLTGGGQVLINPANPDHMLARRQYPREYYNPPQSKLYVSVDRGLTWTPTDMVVTQVEFDAVDPSIVYACA